MKTYNQIYYELNKEKCKQHSRDYYLENKDDPVYKKRMRDYHDVYYQMNKEKILSKIKIKPSYKFNDINLNKKNINFNCNHTLQETKKGKFNLDFN